MNTVSEQVKELRRFSDEYARNHVTLFNYRENMLKRALMETENRYIKLAKHCIGLDRKKTYTRHGKRFYRPYRNYFATGRNYEDWEAMELAGYAERGEQNQHGGYTFYLTRAGLDWLGKKLGIYIYDESD